MMNTLVATNEQVQQCIENQLDVVIWLFDECDGTAQIIAFTDDKVKADNGFWYVRRHCRLYV